MRRLIALLCLAAVYVGLALVDHSWVTAMCGALGGALGSVLTNLYRRDQGQSRAAYPDSAPVAEWFARRRGRP